MFVFIIFVGEFLDEYIRFPKSFIKILFVELNIFHFIVLLRKKYLDRVNIAVWRICDVITPLNK